MDIICAVVITICFLCMSLFCKFFLTQVLQNSGSAGKPVQCRPCFGAVIKYGFMQLIQGTDLSATKQGACITVLWIAHNQGNDS